MAALSIVEHLDIFKQIGSGFLPVAIASPVKTIEPQPDRYQGPSSGSSTGSSTSTSRVSPVSSIGGERWSKPERRPPGQSFPRSRIAAPVGTMRTALGIGAIGRDSVLCSGTAIGADKACQHRIDVELRARIVRNHVHSEPQIWHRHQFRKHIAQRGDIMDQAFTIGTVRNARTIADRFNGIAHRVGLQDQACARQGSRIKLVDPILKIRHQPAPPDHRGNARTVDVVKAIGTGLLC